MSKPALYPRIQKIKIDGASKSKDLCLKLFEKYFPEFKFKFKSKSFKIIGYADCGQGYGYDHDKFLSAVKNFTIEVKNNYIGNITGCNLCPVDGDDGDDDDDMEFPLVQVFIVDGDMWYNNISLGILIEVLGPNYYLKLLDCRELPSEKEWVKFQKKYPELQIKPEIDDIIKIAIKIYETSSRATSRSPKSHKVAQKLFQKLVTKLNCLENLYSAHFTYVPRDI